MELSRNAYFTWDKIIAQVLSVSLVKALYNVLHALELTSGTSRVGFILIDWIIAPRLRGELSAVL